MNSDLAPIPDHTGLRTVFFLADVEPKEVMNFGVRHGIRLSRAATVEVFGHLLGMWAVTRESITSDGRLSRTEDLFDVTLAMYALIRLERGKSRKGLPQRATMHSCVEIRGVAARENVLRTLHGRYREGSVQLGCEEADDFRIAARAAWRFVRHPPVRVAFKDYSLSLRERGDDAFLYAYRAVEGIRRAFPPDEVKRNGHIEQIWLPMHSALETTKEMLQPLTDAATAVRHGDIGSPAVRRARRGGSRERTLGLAEDVLRRYARHVGVTW